MIFDRWAIPALWISFVVFWAAAAFGAKRSIPGRSWLRGAGLRLIALAVVFLAVRLLGLRHALLEVEPRTASPLLVLIGAAVCAAGLGYSVLARVHLGRNWGMPMTRKQDPELVMHGPYAYSRHPIYAGVIVAMLGSAVGQNVLWLVPLVVFGVYFSYSARQEEQLMAEQFPDRYPAYKRRTKMFIPFLF